MDVNNKQTAERQQQDGFTMKIQVSGLVLKAQKLKIHRQINKYHSLNCQRLIVR